ncbi:DUF4834 domain-containing protein [Flavobacterium sp. DGU11]|uniref:DUF4834 domain-containing protein n=1 Tax=Flavobacterium arundinis TaxID=3139143 RepID=A0ABU9I1A1_9FLAO
MVTASFTGFLKTIAILILVYYAVKYLLKVFAPVIIQQVVKKAEQSFYEQQQNAQQPQQQAYANTSDRPKEKKKVGEYIDFEEIE